MRYAIIENGIVTNIVVADAETAAVNGWVEAGPAQIGWVLDGGALSPPPPPTLEEVKAARKTDATAERYARETGGITISGASVDTSREAQGLITGAALAATLDPAYTVTWKCAGGVFRTFDAAALLGLAQAVRSHVQACFDREAALHAAIDAATTVEDVAAVDITAGWPE